MIADPRPLQPEYVPDDVVNRKAEINALSAAIQPVTAVGGSDAAILHGPTGTGKTCIARHTLGRLEVELGVRTQYVNCWEHHRAFQLLHHLLQGINEAQDLHRHGTPIDVLLSRLRDRSRDPYVVVLDEIDQLEDTNVLYNLFRVAGLDLILITDCKRDFLASQDEQLTSRLRTIPSIAFDRYSTEELVEILRERARKGLRSGAIKEKQLHCIADAAAGDARLAIETLRRSGRLAGRDRVNGITDRIISKAIPEAKSKNGYYHV